MPVAKKTEKVSAVHVETKKMNDDCCSSKSCAPSLCGGKCKIGHLVVIGLLLLNTILSIVALTSSSKIEAMKVGGRDNYELVQKIYQSKTFQAQQKQQIEQALQMYQGTATQGAPTAQGQGATPSQAQLQAQAQAAAQSAQAQPQTLPVQTK